MTTYTITVPKVGKYMNANDRPNRWDKARATALQGPQRGEAGPGCDPRPGQVPGHRQLCARH